MTFDIQKGGENRTVGWVTRGCENAGNNYDFTGSGFCSPRSGDEKVQKLKSCVLVQRKRFGFMPRW